jgi:aminopeptidase N
MAVVVVEDTTSRYHHLLKLIDNGMGRARSSLNTPQLVEESYGEDASVFGGSEMLVGVMDSVLDKIQPQVREDLLEYLQQQDFPQRLATMECVIAKLQKEEAFQAQAERHDRTSAQEVLDATLLPAGVTLEDVLAFRNYERQKRQREELQDQEKVIQEEIAELERLQVETQATVQSDLQELEDVAHELERSADVCSMVVSN